MKITKNSVKELLIITFAVGIVAAAVHFFMMPSKVSVGSATALAMVLSNFIPMPVSIITLIMNIFLLILSFILIGPEFGGKTTYGAILLPVILRIFEMLFPDFQSLTQDPLLDTMCYILIVGVGLGMLFTYNASTGGLEIVAKLMSKYLRMDVGQALSISGILVALSSALCYDKEIVVLSVLGTYFGGMLVDHFIFDINIKRKVCILSSQFDQIMNYILHDLHSGASIYELTGAYDGQVRKEIVTIVDKQEYKALMDFVKKTDPKAFMTVYSVNDVSYQPKK